METMMNNDIEANQQLTALEKGLTMLLNQHSAENDSDTPDYILAKYLTDCLSAYNSAVKTREIWYGRSHAQVVSTTLTDAVRTELREESLHTPYMTDHWFGKPPGPRHA